LSIVFDFDGGGGGSAPAPAGAWAATPTTPAAPAPTTPATSVSATSPTQTATLTPTPTPTTPLPDTTELVGSASIILVYGDSGNYKTTQATQYAEYILERTGRMTRLVTAESSCYEAFLPYVQLGLVDPLFISVGTKPRSALRKILRGEWLYFLQFPFDPLNPRGRLTIAQKGTRGCGQLAWFSPDPKAPNYSEQAREDLEACGGYIFEGCTTLAEACMQALTSDRTLYAKILSGKKDNEGMDMATGLAAPGYEEEGEMLGQHNKSHYGAIQKDVVDWIKQSPKELYRASRGRIKHVLWTSHEAKGTDDFDKITTIYGPAIVGQKGGDKLQKDVGTMIHMDSVLKPDGSREVRAYFREHMDPDPMQAGAGVKWQAKPRLSPTPEALKALEQRYPGGYFVPTPIGALGEVTLRTFLLFMDTLQETSTNRIQDRLARIRESRAPKPARIPEVEGEKIAPIPPKSPSTAQVTPTPQVEVTSPAPPAPAAESAPVPAADANPIPEPPPKSTAVVTPPEAAAVAGAEDSVAKDKGSVMTAAEAAAVVVVEIEPPTDLVGAELAKLLA
jgi:hypothetical protein